MYRRKEAGWMKHFDFMVLDVLCLQLSFILACWMRHGFYNPYRSSTYVEVTIFMVLFDLLSLVMMNSLKDVLRHDYKMELKSCVKHSFTLLVATASYLYFVKQGESFSRTVFFLTILIHGCCSYIVRLVWTKHLHTVGSQRSIRSLLIVAEQEHVVEIIRDIQNHNYVGYHIAGLVLYGEERIGRMIDGVPVVANEHTLVEYVCHEWVDEVFIQETFHRFPKQTFDQLINCGITVQISLGNLSNFMQGKQQVGKVADYTVLTTTMNFVTYRQEFLKRVMDICAGLVGCLITGVLFLFVAPAIYVASPGPIFFSQVRIGKNGRRFKIYKFRSMYMDAEERKKELLSQNSLDDERMFKMEFDPRIIGNKVLPDGTKKTGIGQWIRSTSIDEFPQFWNVLKGDMSLIGTRPPTEDEWIKYELHHRARMAIKPGITGMWQVSGRSTITDFEEVVRLDTKYISEWNLWLDMKILWKTFFVVFQRNGSM